jgi:phosphohistidine phosphatase SixA
MRFTIKIATLLAASAMAAGFNADGARAELTGEALMNALKSGGYVIYMRHGASERSQTDADPVDLNNCATQRNLSGAGKDQGKSVAAAFESLKIPVDKVYAGPFCLAKEYASIAFPKSERQVTSALHYSLALSKDDAAKAAGELKKLMGAAPKPGTNTVMVGHNSNIKEVAGVWPKNEGGSFVFKAKGDGSLELIGAFDSAEIAKMAGG